MCFSCCVASSFLSVVVGILLLSIELSRIASPCFVLFLPCVRDDIACVVLPFYRLCCLVFVPLCCVALHCVLLVFFVVVVLRCVAFCFVMLCVVALCSVVVLRLVVYCLLHCGVVLCC